MKPSRNLIAYSLFSGFLLSMTLLLMAAGSVTYRQNDFLNNLRLKMEERAEKFPEERIYLQFDKPFYAPGEDVWFSGWLREGISLDRSPKSDILHVELISPRGNVEKHIKLIAKDGQVSGDFHIDPNAAGGIYKVRAKTQWQENDPNAFIFEKELTVQKVVLPNLKMKLDFERKAFGPGDEVLAKLILETNENEALSDHDFRFVASIDGQEVTSKASRTDKTGRSFIRFELPKNLSSADGLLNVMIEYQGLNESVSRSIPIVLNKIDLGLYPEGGDLVDGLAGRVAFRARNEFGKPADIEGVVTDSKGQEVARFSSFHQGMGAFDFTPAKGEVYTASITKPEGVKETFTLPQPMPRGFVMQADAGKEFVELRIASTEDEAVSLVANVRGKAWWTGEVELKKGDNTVRIPTAGMPAGVAQLTLFDKLGVARCERLAFVNRDRRLKVSIHTDKEQYLPREKVKMDIEVTDERGMPVPSQLALSVVNDQLLSFADDKSGNILSVMLLEADLKEKVEEPKFYFDDKEPKSTQALDYLLMTAGWRRFTWKEAIAGTMPAVRYQGERAVISGQILDQWSGQPVPYASITSIKGGYGILSDKEGRFKIESVDITEGGTVQIMADNYTQTEYTFANYGENQYVYIANPQARREMMGFDEFGDDFDRGMDVEERNAIPMMDEPVMLMAVEVADIAVAENNDGAGGRRGMRKEEAKVPAMRAKDKEMKVVEVMDGIEPDRRDNRKQTPDDVQSQLEDLEDPPMGNIVMNGTIADTAFAAFDFKGGQPVAVQGVYYRARQFEAPEYKSKGARPEERSDFRQTLYWNPMIETSRNGRAQVEFYASDEITSFRATVEGIGTGGLVGHSEFTFHTQMPFAVRTRIPAEVASLDEVKIPLTLTNNTDKTLNGILKITVPEQLEALNLPGSSLTIPAGESVSLFPLFKARHCIGTGELAVSFKAEGMSDVIRQKVEVRPQGFPVNVSFGGQEPDRKEKVRLNHVVDGSIELQLTAFPNVVSDLLQGVESLLREPGGCFEQTSMSSYPNAMALGYLKEQENPDPAVMTRATELLDRGYKRLTSFETNTKGYEWFGSSPGHEALTAYGLLQFHDYSLVYEGVDRSMVDRTAKWLMGTRDGQGGFSRNQRTADYFGRANEDVTNGYIVFALTEAGYKDIDKELDRAVKRAIASNDAYQLALAANAAGKIKDSRRKQLMDKLVLHQREDGAFGGAAESITRSGGISLDVETTSLAVLAMMKDPAGYNQQINKGVEFLVKNRSAYGGFGSTQATILALKALTEYARFSRRTKEAGTIIVSVDGKDVAEKAYEAGATEAVVIEGLGAYLSEGDHDIRVRFKGVKEALPWSVSLNYHTTTPQSSADCVVDLRTELQVKEARMGETVRLHAELKNLTDKGQPMTMAVLGIPAGLSPQPWQLKEMQEKGVFDYYEIIGNRLACYYRDMAPGEKIEINLDLKADVPGSYESPASCAYLYYTAEHRDWEEGLRIKVKN